MSKPIHEREAWTSYMSKCVAGCPLITDAYVSETNRLWDTEGLSEAMRTLCWSMNVILSRYPSLLGIIKRNIDRHAVLDDRQMFSIQQEGVRMKIRSQVKPNLKKDAFAMLVVFFCKLGELPDTETFVLTGAVLVKAATLWNVRLKVYIDKSTKDYVAHGGEPADVWYAIILMLTAAVSELLHNNAENARTYNKIASSTRLLLLEPMLPHEEKLHAWLKTQPEVCRVGLQAHRAYGVKWVDVIHTFALWFKDAFTGGFAAVSVRSFQDELLALRDGGSIPEIFRGGIGDDENETLIPELDLTDIVGASSPSKTATGSKGFGKTISQLRNGLRSSRLRKP